MARKPRSARHRPHHHHKSRKAAANAGTDSSTFGEAGKDLQPEDVEKEERELDAQLATAGLVRMPALRDGNCMFSALTMAAVRARLELTGDVRHLVCNYIADHEDDYVAFLPDETMAAYLARMKRNGVWGSALELQAASLALHANVYVHQGCRPDIVVENWTTGEAGAEPSAPWLRLAYIGYEHYDAVVPADPALGWVGVARSCSEDAPPTAPTTASSPEPTVPDAAPLTKQELRALSPLSAALATARAGQRLSNRQRKLLKREGCWPLKSSTGVSVQAAAPGEKAMASM